MVEARRQARPSQLARRLRTAYLCPGYPVCVAKTTQQLLAEAEKKGVKVTVVTKAPATGEIALRPGLREAAQA